MQFNQPNCFAPQPYPYNSYNIPFQCNAYPEIIGEGNITSVMSPDGSTLLLFLPTQRWKPYPTSFIGQCNLNNPYWNNLGAWFVRGVVNSFQPNVFCQPCPTLPLPWDNRNFPREYELKFHNDTCTSTSDLQYFCPKQYNWYRRPSRCAAVQVDIPIVPMIRNDVFYPEVVVCSKPCNCTPQVQFCNTITELDQSKNTSSENCECKKQTVSDNSVTPCSDAMSCDESQETGKNECKKYSEKSKHEEMTSSDKSVATCTDKATTCGEDYNRLTQIAKGKICKHSNKRIVKPELWIPKSPQSKKSMKSTSLATFRGICPGESSSDHCSCDSENEL